MKTNRKLPPLILLLSAVMVLASCSNKRTAEDSKRKAAGDVPDTTIYARLNAVDNDSIDITMINHDKSFRFSIAESRKEGGLSGDMNIGDTLAVMAVKKKKKVISCVNMSQIVGLWFIAGGHGDGLRLASDGGASWIGEKDVTMRAWHISNGMFILNYIKADGSDYREIPDTAEIKKLGKDSLTMVFKEKTLSLIRSKGLVTIDAGQ